VIARHKHMKQQQQLQKEEEEEQKKSFFFNEKNKVNFFTQLFGFKSPLKI